MRSDEWNQKVPGTSTPHGSTTIAPNFRRVITEGRRAVARLEPVLSSENLSLEEWLILDVLSDADGLSMSQLGSETLASSATLSRHVDSLVNRACVYRQVGAEDRRQFLIFMSTRGRALHGFVAGQLRELAAND